MARSPAKRASSSRDGESDEEGGRVAELKRVKLEKGPVARARSQSRIPSNGINRNGKGDGMDVDGEESTSDDDSSSESDEDDVAKRTEFPDEEANLKAFEAARERQGKKIGSQALAGVIKEVTLINFMNHEHFSQDFGPRMNFLVGHNGSGKSAVLTGIAVALGSKASTTGRGAGLKHLIRRDTNVDKAEIILVLSNEGDDAYRPDVYPKEIVIQRTITSSGASSYKFRGTKTGKIIETKREELVRICENFHITIESPLTLLTQDQARTFLQSSDDEKLYTFFLRGTTLQSLLETYNNIDHNLASIRNVVKRQEEALPDLADTVEHHRRRVDAADRTARLQDSLNDVRHELAWAFVSESEEKRDGIAAEIEALQEKIALGQKKLEEAEDSLPEVEQQVGDIEAEMKRLDESRGPRMAESERAKIKVTETNRLIATKESDIANCEKDIATARNEIANLDRQIEQKRQAIAGDLDPEQEAYRQSLSQKQELLRKNRREVGDTEEAIRNKKSEHDEAEIAASEATSQYSAQEKALAALELKKSNLESQRGNQLRKYGGKIDDLLSRINKARWKHSKPLGPLGQWVHLKDRAFTNVMQTTLGATLCGFAVRCEEDRAQLMAICQQAAHLGYRPTAGDKFPAIIQHSGERFDFSHGDLSRLGETILSKLNIDNEDVLRIMVNAHNIEQVFVSKTSVTADQEITKQFHNGSQHVVVLSADGFRSEGKLRRGANPSEGNRTSGPLPLYTGTPLFTSDVAADLRSLAGEIDQARRDLAEAQRVRDEAVVHARRTIQALDSFKTKLQKMSREAIELQKAIDELQDKLEERTETDLSAFEQEKTSYLDNLVTLEKQVKMLDEEVEALRSQKSQYVAKRESISAELEAYTTEMAGLRKSIQTLALDRATKQGVVNHWKKRIEGWKSPKAELEAKLEAAQREVEACVTGASSTFPGRIPTTKSIAQLTEAEKTSLKAIETARRRNNNVNPEEAAAALKEETEKYQMAQKQITAFTMVLKQMERSLATRKTRWIDIRGRICVTARCNFIMSTEKRSMSLRLDFDHAAGRLSIKSRLHDGALLVDNDLDDESASTQKQRSVKTFSGGERSFSTVCLLLSLWETVACPIRCLDEWDVFLDSANRQLAGKMLMDGARESDGKQFILITPQDMAGFKPDAQNKIIRMADPIRSGQRRLDFQHVST